MAREADFLAYNNAEPSRRREASSKESGKRAGCGAVLSNLSR